MAKWKRPSALSPTNCNNGVTVARCTACGYVYAEATASVSSSGVKAGTKFEDLPKDWKRPSEKALQRPCAAARGLPNPAERPRSDAGFSVARCPVCGAEKSAFEKVVVKK